MPQAQLQLAGWERRVASATRTWSAAGRQALVAGVLAVAATLMVLAWIYHLKRPQLSFMHAYLLSLALVAVEFFLNTWITRYSYSESIFLPGQLAMISIVSGILVLAVLLLTLFRSPRNAFDASAAFALLLVLLGTVLLLRHRTF